MNTRNIAILAVVATGFCLPGAVLAAPALRADIIVVSEVVTVGDMFDDAGLLAERGLFRAPLPGTTGIVSLDAIRRAAAAIGLSEFSSDGIDRVRVARATTIVDGTALVALIDQELETRGVARDGIVVQPALDSPDLSFNAEAVDAPARLLSLRYTPGDSDFSARFQIVGHDLPVDVTGSVLMLIEAPHLATSKPSGALLGPDDIEMRLVPLKVAEPNGGVTLDQLVGKQLQRQSRAGLMLRASDVAEPQTVLRNSLVTVILRSGSMTLTVKGQALNNASAGQSVQVLNSMTKKIIHGVATSNGTVEITNTVNVAGL